MPDHPINTGTGLPVTEPGLPPRSADKYDAPSLVGNQARRRFHVMVKVVF